MNTNVENTLFSTLQQSVIIVLFALVYYVVGEYSLFLGRMDVGHVTAIWPAAGLGFAMVYLYGYRFAVSIFLGELHNLFIDPSSELLPNALTALGNTSAVILGVWFLKRFFEKDILFSRVTHVVWFIGICVVFAGMISSTIGVTVVILYKHYIPCGVLGMWWTWFLADMVGVLTIAPLIISCYQRNTDSWYEPHWAEFLGLLFSLSLCAWFIFGQPVTDAQVRAYPLPFILMPFLLWAAFRFGLRETLFSMVLLMTIAVAGTLQGHGPFAVYSNYESLLLLQSFIGVMGIMSLFLNAVISERCQLEKHLYAANAYLEQRVLERTESLRRSTEKYQSIFEHAIEGIYQVSPDGRLLSANPALAYMYGYENADALIANTFNIERFYVDSGQRSLFLKHLKQHGKVQAFEIEVYRKEGDTMWIAENCRAVYDQHQQLLYYEGTMLDITERKESQAQLYQLAHHDPLTGLINRRLFEIRLKKALAHAKNMEQRGLLMYFDLDGFKKINDELGHAAGDELLKMVAQRLKMSLRDSDMICRLGGDEFTVIAENVSYQQDAEIMAQKVLEAISQPYVLAGKTAHVGVSIGMSFFDGRSYDTKALIQQADQAMYRAKQAGKGCYTFHHVDVAHHTKRI